MLLLAVVVRNNMAQVFLILTQIFIQLTKQQIQSKIMLDHKFHLCSHRIHQKH